MTGRFRWVAGADRIAHAVPARSRGWSKRTACGVSITDELPIRTRLSRCSSCRALVGLAL